MHKHPQFSAYLALASVCLFWGTTYLGIRIAVESLPPATLMCTRYLLSGGVMVVLSKMRGARFPKGRELWITAACGIMTIGLGTGLLAFVEQWAPSGLSALFVTTSPFWLAATEAILPGGEPMHLPTIYALLVGAAGVVVLVTGGDSLSVLPGGPGVIECFFILQLGSVFWALGSIVQRRQTSSTHPFVSAAVQQLAAGMIYSVPVLFQQHTAKWNSVAVAAMLYLAVFGGIVGYSSYVFAMNRLPVAVASMYTYINPLVAVWLGWLVYRESFSAREALGMVIIFAGVWLVKKTQARAHRPQRPESITGEGGGGGNRPPTATT